MRQSATVEINGELATDLKFTFEGNKTFGIAIISVSKSCINSDTNVVTVEKDFFTICIKDYELLDNCLEYLTVGRKLCVKGELTISYLNSENINSFCQTVINIDKRGQLKLHYSIQERKDYMNKKLKVKSVQSSIKENSNQFINNLQHNHFSIGC